MLTQKLRIFRDLKRGWKLQPLMAIHHYGTMKLSTRIGEIEKERGIAVNRKMVERNGKRFMEYWL